MAKVANYRQTKIRLARDVITVGQDVYALDDVLYAEVVDAQGRHVTGWARREDFAFLFWASFLTLFSGFFATLGLMIHSETFEAPEASPLVVRVHLRDGSMEPLQTVSLLRGQLLAARINWAAKRRMISKG